MDGSVDNLLMTSGRDKRSMLYVKKRSLRSPNLAAGAGLYLAGWDFLNELIPANPAEVLPEA